ncbi:MAG: type I DNA topoisomerase [Candidatus Omnitrophica bacterium]|nr:type I DNA topoisomerase [Candidatus Omnitrophota bacterium]
MAKKLVIVESPAKSKTINKFLGKEYVVTSSMGHIVDLPKGRMGIEIKNDFKPEYVVIPDRKKYLTKLKKEIEGKTELYLAPDPDREGEAISWHLSNLLGKKRKVFRVSFNEITKDAVCRAFKNPNPSIDMNKVHAQQARRLLDRIVGYTLSPLLWKKVTRGLSAGRVQSVAVRLIVERERAIRAFVPQEYWEIAALLKKEEDERRAFTAKLEKIDDKKPEIKTEDTANKLVREIEKEEFVVSDIKDSKKKKKASPPFTTSVLQQDAFNKLRFPVNKTMRMAQQLYEGIDLEKDESVGLITYMRTDSVRISADGQKATREYILKKYGKEYYPANPNVYKSKKSAQEAHEAIRPTLPLREPESVKGFLTSDQFRLYELIWNRFLASQMSPALLSLTQIDIKAGRSTFRSSGTKVIFKGFMVIYKAEPKKDTDDRRKDIWKIPVLEVGEKLNLIKLMPSQHFTKPPPRYSDASLVKDLEEKGIGRPSTYAPIIYTIIMRNYMKREKGYLYPTELGVIVNDLLIAHFPKVLNIKFTATMEEELDDVENGQIKWTKVLKDFYEPFSKNLELAKTAMESVKKKAIKTDEVCKECGRPMVIKWGRRGKFLSCSGFPECRYSRSITTGVKCLNEGCDGELIERRSKKRGMRFYGCSNYPKCTYTANRLPEEKDKSQGQDSPK